MHDIRFEGTAVETRGRCPVCRAAVIGSATVQCPQCTTAHHLECWRYAGGCTVFGCAPASGPGETDRGKGGARLTPTRPRDESPWVGLVAPGLVLGPIGLVIGGFNWMMGGFLGSSPQPIWGLVAFLGGASFLLALVGMSLPAEAARILGLHRNGLAKMMKRLGLK